MGKTAARMARRTPVAIRERRPRGTTRVTRTLPSVPSTTAAPTTKPSQATAVTWRGRCAQPWCGQGTTRRSHRRRLVYDCRSETRGRGGARPARAVPGSSSLGERPLSILRYIADNWDSLWPHVGTHLEIVLVSIAVASVLGLALGVASARSER